MSFKPLLPARAAVKPRLVKPTPVSGQLGRGSAHRSWARTPRASQGTSALPGLPCPAWGCATSRRPAGRACAALRGPSGPPGSGAQADVAELPRLCPCQQEKDPAEGLPSGSVEGSLDATKVPRSRASSGGAMQGKSSAAGARGAASRGGNCSFEARPSLRRG